MKFSLNVYVRVSQVLTLADPRCVLQVWSQAVHPGSTSPLWNLDAGCRNRIVYNVTSLPDCLNQPCMHPRCHSVIIGIYVLRHWFDYTSIHRRLSINQSNVNHNLAARFPRLTESCDIFFLNSHSMFAQSD